MPHLWLPDTGEVSLSWPQPISKQFSHRRAASTAGAVFSAGRRFLHYLLARPTGRCRATGGYVYGVPLSDWGVPADASPLRRAGGGSRETFSPPPGGSAVDIGSNYGTF